MSFALGVGDSPRFDPWAASWWFHSWSDKNLKIDNVEKEGPWTIYRVSVLPPAQN